MCYVATTKLTAAKGGMVILFCQLQNQPPIPRERYVFWWYPEHPETWSNSHVDQRTVPWSEIAKSGFDHDCLQTALRHRRHPSAQKSAVTRKICCIPSRAQLHTNAPEPPKNMGWLHRANEKEH